MSPQKPLTHFFKPLQSGGVKRSFSELVSSSKQSPETKIVEKDVVNHENVRVLEMFLKLLLTSQIVIFLGC